MNETADENVLELLIGQHMRIRDLFTEVQNTAGSARQDAFARLVRLLAVHETAEEEVIHPLARRTLDGGDAIVDDRLHEENQAKQLLQELESIGIGHERFNSLLSTLRRSVLEHAHHEEQYEFRYLSQQCDADQLSSLATMVRLAERTAPTHPHPGTESATENLVAGPVLAVYDRVRDAIRNARTTQ